MIDFLSVVPSKNAKYKFVSSTLRNFSKKPVSKSKKYSHTLNLPVTKFQNWVSQEKRVLHDESISEKYGFSDFYRTQRGFQSRPDFILHDGPPYANGDVHMGHAVNKILKDIINRRKLLEGFRVHYVPGWDCHGLPIELKAMEHSPKSGSSAIEIRKAARKFAEETIERQKKCFKSWGVMADWESNCYSTFNKTYTQQQFRLFYDLYEKGLIYRGLKPVHWSPSSRTALAEAELEYNDEHESISIFLRLRLNKLPETLSFSIGTRDAFAIIWTTTPWSLPSNTAVAFNPDLEYSWITFSLDSSEVYLVASSLIKNLEEKLKKSCQVITQFAGEKLCGVMYQHPLKPDSVHPFLGAKHVTKEKGTGLVHTAPAHGPDDFKLALKHKISIINTVDEAGLYSAEAGKELEGLSIFSEGAEKVKQILRPDILLEERFIHSYPYDWRTKKPIIIRASDQWFIDTGKIEEDALGALKCVAMSGIAKLKDLETRLQQRSFWCISRQRVWGAPIPVVYNSSTNEPIINESLIEHYCSLIDKTGSDFWWTVPTSELIPEHLRKELNLKEDGIEKGRDILDIWFDSGVSWACVLPDDKVADVYLEGIDQLTGWFQSSLLMSVAARNKAPYKNIVVHGFAVDENKRKMSKSLGNVISPLDIIAGGKDLKRQPAYGIDVLRWWVASHGVVNTSIPVTPSTLQSGKDEVQRIRLIMKFLLGALNDYSPKNGSVVNLSVLDKYTLNCLREFLDEMKASYSSYSFEEVCQTVMKLLANEVSSFYLHLTKDRLYCDGTDSSGRRACQYTLAAIFETLLFTIAPILPHLTEEVYSYYAAKPAGSAYFFMDQNLDSARWQYSEAKGTIELLKKVKASFTDSLPPSKKDIECDLFVRASPEVYSILQTVTELELMEIMQVAKISITQDASLEEEFTVKVESTSNHLCERCRLHASACADSLCNRCLKVIESLSS